MRLTTSTTTWLATLLLSMAIGPASLPARAETPATMAAHPERQADMEVFVREGCPHCARAEVFLEQLKLENPALWIVVRDVGKEPAALQRLQQLADSLHVQPVRVPAFAVGGRLIIGFSDAIHSDALIREALAGRGAVSAVPTDGAASCETEESLACIPEASQPVNLSPPENFAIDFLGRTLRLDDIGLPLFTLAMGVLDGFNPCSMWVLILMISLLAPMNNRGRMLAVAGAFVAVEGIAYFAFMAAWLNLFILIGLSRASELIIAAIAILAGAINLKDFWAFGWGVSLSIPDSAKPGIYARIRAILQAKNLTGALIGAVVLALLVQIVEFICTSGFPVLYTRILTLKEPDALGYYAYLLLYDLAYMFDDIIVLGIGVVTLSQRRLQEREGRWLKLLSGMVMVGLGVYLIVAPGR